MGADAYASTRWRGQKAAPGGRLDPSRTGVRRDACRYDGLAKRYAKAIARLEKLKAAYADKVNRERETRGFIDALTTSPLVLDAWDEQVWRMLVVMGAWGGMGGSSLIDSEKGVHLPDK